MDRPPRLATVRTRQGLLVCGAQSASRQPYIWYRHVKRVLVDEDGLERPGKGRKGDGRTGKVPCEERLSEGGSSGLRARRDLFTAFRI